jgi:hypothetical protein
MRTSVDRGTLEGQEPRWKQACRTGAIIVGLVVLCVIIAAIGCNEQFSKGGRLPEIVSFQANPPVNAGDPVSYTFEVKNATKIRLIEAGGTIKEINGPSSGIYAGAATGQAPSTVLTSDNGTFDAVLEASNEQGTVKKAATLSDSALLRNNPNQPQIAKGWADRPCPTGCGCLLDWQGQGLTQCGTGECQGPWIVHSASTIKHCYRIPVAQCQQGCSCIEPSQAEPDLQKCNPYKCGVNPDKYCYNCRYPCTCMKPAQAPPGYIKCSDKKCNTSPDKYCYQPACPQTGCQCLLDTVVAPCNWPQCTSSYPCDPNDPAKHCYKCPSTAPNCLTPADAANPSWGFDDTDPSACKCSNPGEQDKWCYHKKKTWVECDNTTGCVCWPDSYINTQCAGQNMQQCPGPPCFSGTSDHCYRCPPGCECFADSDSFNRISENYTVPCTSGNCICKESATDHYRCWKRPGT